jgi:GT2 family glycosyltransferase
MKPPCRSAPGRRADPEPDPPVSGAGPAPEISVVIPHLNQPEQLAGCLAALAAQQPAGLRDRAEIIVVDNGSCRPPEEVVARFPGVRLLREPAPGPGPARNRGVRGSRAPVIAFLDADCVAAPDWLARIGARFAAEPEAAILGGDIRTFVPAQGPLNTAEAFDLVYGFRQERQIARRGFAATANLAVRRRVFDETGPFADIDVAEDMDWGLRAARLGHRTRYAAEVVVHHPARRSLGELRRQWDRHISHAYLMQPWVRGDRLRWMLRAGLIAVSPLAEMPRILGSHRLTTTRDRLLAIIGLVRIRLYRARRMLAALLDPRLRTANRHWNRPPAPIRSGTSRSAER